MAKVKALFAELELQRMYEEYEESSYQDLMQLIEKLSGKLPKQIFTAFAQKIYKRNK